MKAKVHKKIYVENLLSRASQLIFNLFLINPCNFLKWIDYISFFKIPGKLYIIYSDSSSSSNLYLVK